MINAPVVALHFRAFSFLEVGRKFVLSSAVSLDSVDLNELAA